MSVTTNLLLRIHAALGAASFLATLSVLVIVAHATIEPIQRGVATTHGLLFPVVEDVMLHAEAAENETRIHGSFTKIRQCQFLRVEWRLGPRSVKIAPLISVAIDEGPKLRMPGPASFGPWRIGVDLERFQSTYADVIHNCGAIGGGVVRSRFWTGDQAY